MVSAGSNRLDLVVDHARGVETKMKQTPHEPRATSLEIAFPVCWQESTAVLSKIGNKTGRMSALPFSTEHRARFQELHAVGELYAVKNEKLDFGPWWLVGCELTDSDHASRLKARFRAAVQRAAMSAGGPYRVNRLDWWIGQLTHGKPLAYIRDLIQRSIEYCEELEIRALELGERSTKPDGLRVLYRDRYPCDWGEPYSLYDGPIDSFSDPKVELEWWTEHIWSEYNGLIAKLGQIHGARKRLDKEKRKEFRDRTARRVHSQYARMKRTILGLSYDLAVLHANRIIDCGLHGDAAMRAFQDQSAGLIVKVRMFGRQSYQRLGLSYSRHEKEGLDPAKPFREVGEDLRNVASGSQLPAPENASVEVLKTGKRRGRRPNSERSDAICATIHTHGGQWRDHLEDIFAKLDSQEVPLGDFLGLKIDLGEGESTPVSTWVDLDLAAGKQRRQIVDALRKYAR
jgi:hypothetical protein